MTDNTTPDNAKIDTVECVNVRTKPHYWIMKRGADFWNRWARGEFPVDTLQKRRMQIEKNKNLFDRNSTVQLKAWDDFISMKEEPLTIEEKQELEKDIKRHCDNSSKIPCPSEIIDFENTYWRTGNIDFHEFVHHDVYDFKQFIFPSEVNFNNTIFNEIPINFGNAKFSGGDANFDGAQFRGGYAEFENAQFSGGDALFSNIQFIGGYANFRSTQFSGGNAEFENAQFSGGYANFFYAQFSGGYVHFRNAQFSGGFTDFSQAQFSGGDAYFENAQFSGRVAFFSNTQFSGGNAYFENAQFSGRNAHFARAQFSGGNAHFDGAEFSGGDADFKETCFTEQAYFDNSEFKKNAYFRSANFENEVPSFNGVTFNGMFDVLDTKFPSFSSYDICRPKLEKKTDNKIKNHMIAYSQIKRRMEDLSMHDLEIKFHAMELEARSYCDDKKLQRIMIAFYGVVSDYGRSVWRPLTLWFVMLIGYIAVYNIYTDDIWRALFLSVKHAAPFIPADTVIYKEMFGSGTGICCGTCHADTAQCYFWFSIWRGFHIFFSLIMLFLTGLAIRNKLRLR